MKKSGAAQETHDGGFTLVELLVVIVVLGVLATVVVFSVSGLTSDGNAQAAGTDERTLVTALEAYRAMNGEYPTEAILVSEGWLREESEIHDVTINGDGTYTLVAVSP